jgi:hypothetical protein
MRQESSAKESKVHGLPAFKHRGPANGDFRAGLMQRGHIGIVSAGGGYAFDRTGGKRLIESFVGPQYGFLVSCRIGHKKISLAKLDGAASCHAITCRSGIRA